MLDVVKSWMWKYLKSAKMLYLIIVLVAFVVLRGVIPHSFNDTRSQISEVQESSAVYLPGITTHTFLSTAEAGSVTQASARTTQMTESEAAEERKAFGNSNGLGYTIEEFNRLTEQELLTFHGVGAATARAIVELRTLRGGFKSFDELLDVRGIGTVKLRKILGERDEAN